VYRTRENWADLLQKMGLLWTHDGNPKRPHALLTSGGHSDGFFNGNKLLSDYPRLARELAYDLVELPVREVFSGHNLGSELQGAGFMPNRVIGPAFGAITWADKIADALNVGSAFTIPIGEGKDKTFKLEKRFNINGELVLLAEDTITTGGSVEKTIAVVLENGAKIAPIIVAICNRSGLAKIGDPKTGDYKIVAMIEKHMQNWDPKVHCPLCKLGSEAIRPKEANNWVRLTATY
jgi:orotate phosphoribosyltransferase